MSASFHKKMKGIDPLGHAVVEGVFGIGKQAASIAAEKKKQTDYEAGQATRAAEMEKRRGVQVDTRAQAIAAASAAGATRIGNDADLLGTSAGGAKRRYASRVLLGE